MSLSIFARWFKDFIERPNNNSSFIIRMVEEHKWDKMIEKQNAFE